MKLRPMEIVASSILIMLTIIILLGIFVTEEKLYGVLFGAICFIWGWRIGK
jgi:hypothetical protein